MSTDLQPLDLITPQGVMNPDTGELVALADLPTPALARVLGLVQHSIDQHLNALYEAKRLLGGEMIERMDRQGEWTVHAPGVEVRAPSPSAGTVEWDAEKLERLLDELVEEGVIDRAGKQRAIQQEIVLKVDKRGVNALMKIPAVAERIHDARYVTPTGARKASVRVDPRNL